MEFILCYASVLSLTFYTNIVHLLFCLFLDCAMQFARSPGEDHTYPPYPLQWKHRILTTGYQEFPVHLFWLAGWQSCGRPMLCSSGCAEDPGLYHIMTERESFNNNLGHKYTFKLLFILREWELFFHFFCNMGRHKFFTQSVGTYHVPQTLSAIENNPVWTQGLQLTDYLFEHTECTLSFRIIPVFAGIRTSDRNEDIMDSTTLASFII